MEYDAHMINFGVWDTKPNLARHPGKLFWYNIIMVIMTVCRVTSASEPYYYMLWWW